MSVASLSVETSVRSLLSMLSFSNLSRFASGTRFLTTRRRPSFRKNKVYKKSPLTPAKQRLLKIVDQAYELSMIESSDIIFPGEEVNLVGRISVDKQDLAQGKR